MSFVRTFASSRLARLLAAACGSGRLWASSALAASVVTASVVVYRVYFADGSDAGSYPYYNLIGKLTDAADRLLLMNRDKSSKCQVDYANYNGKTSGTKTSQSWWEVVNPSDTPTLPDDKTMSENCNLEAGSHIRLHAKGASGAVLWELFNCRVGNLNPTTATGKLLSFQNGLPWSATGYGYKGRTVAAKQNTAGTLVMQNTSEARLVSSCYADGIGTVYFDAVNGFTGYKQGQLAVEVAYGVFKTNETGAVVSTKRIPDDLELETDADGSEIPGRYVAPDEAHCDEVTADEDGALTTNAYGRCAWVRVNLTGHVFGNDDKALETNDVLNLELPLSGAAGSFANFYRVWAPVQDPAVNPSLAERCRGPMRLQIRRLDHPPTASGRVTMNLDGSGLGDAANENGLLILDNVIVSFPAMQAYAVPRGDYVAGGSRRNVIGWAGAFSSAYPTVGESGLTATAGFTVETNAPPDSSVSAAWIDGVRATMKWRWRYLGLTNDWQSLSLSVADGALVSSETLTLPGLPGDVEFYYDTEIDAPYYGYVDYSGTDKGTPGYSERVMRVESRLDPAAIGVDGLPSTGTDFFTRLREGQSGQLEYRLQLHRVGGSATNELPFHLVSDSTWKAFVKMTTNETSAVALPKGDYAFRIVGVDPAVTFGGVDVTSLPWSGKRLYRSGDADGGWTAISLDAVTGALMFMVVEDAATTDEMTYTVVHADFQDFNTWSDAASTNLYVGAYSESRGKQSGSSPDTREYASELGRWSATASSNTLYWTEGFAVGSSRTPEQGWGDYAAYEAFKRCLTPNGWLAQNGQWTCAKWGESVAGGDMALLLDGAASGSLSFTNSKEMPHGVETFRLKARVAQSAKFEDFAYYWGTALEDMTDYVFTSRAVMGISDSSDFDGNGSVSLVGYYQPGEGCYEVRAERVADDTVRISLYKWVYDADASEVLPKLLGRHASTRKYKKESWLKSDQKAGATSATQKESYYGELFIRCRTTDDGAVVEAGVMSADKKLSDDTTKTTHYYLKYTDADSPYTFGTFGFGSLNCPAQFVKPLWYADGASVKVPNVTGKSKDANNAELSNPACGSGTVEYSGTGASLFSGGASGSRYKNWTFKSNKFAKDEVGSQKAAVAVAPSGTLELFVTEDGTERSVGTAAVTGFSYDTNCTFTVRNSADSLLRLATGAKSADVVVDDLSFTQWCAASYSDSDNADFYGTGMGQVQGCPDYFVYLNGWVDVTTVGTSAVHTVRFDPIRVRAGQVASIRAPLMDGNDGRGVGLGMLSYTYRNADPNCVVRVQWREISGPSLLRAATADWDGWTDVATNDFSKMSAEERAGGTVSAYVGRHGVSGAMRLVIDSQVVADAKDEAKNPDKDPGYGSVEIVSFLARDEPPLDDRCWWGWNLRTTDALSERSLYDGLATDVGLALALNNSVTDGIDEDYKDLYPQKLPFVQTPTFATNLVGEVNFRARRLPGAEGFTEVAVFGAKDGGVTEETAWTWLDTVVVSNDAYCQYSYKTRDGDDYAAFRLAVIGVQEVSPNYAKKMRIDPPAPRVLLDEVYVSEAVRGKLAFRDVAAFRHDLSLNTPVADVTAKTEQPMVKESWGVQGEVYVAQLEEEIDVGKGFDVTLHWFRGQDPWGFDNWRGNAKAESAALTRASGTSAWIYRSSYLDCPKAVILPSLTNEVVQYMLEVRYYTRGAEQPSTNFLSAADWTRPSWYRPVDFNAGRDFSAYTILDTVAPGWAWINEVNVFGTYNGIWYNSDEPRQYVEIAMPREADLTDWTLRFLDGNPQSGAIYTNVVARFGRNIGAGLVPATKTKNAASNCVFLVVAGEKARQSGELDAEDGEVDGYWRLATRGTSAFGSEHQIVANNPVGIQLVRPSGVVEHELLMIGTNFWGASSRAGFDPKAYVDFFSRSEGEGAFFYAGAENGGDACSLGAFRNAGATSNDWTCAMKRTPGRINEGQEIDPNHPTPFGSSVLVYLNVGRHMAQTVPGVATDARDGQIAVVRKGDADGLDVTYSVDRWYELASVTTNGAAATAETAGTRTYRVNVARNCSNDTLTVEAAATVAKALAEDYGLTDDNRYREAVMDWLSSGTDLYGNAWADGGDETVRLAEFWSYNGTFQTNLTLTTMYWLDIPPTEGGWVLRGGVSQVPSGTFPDPNDSSKTNLRIGVYMMISNRNETAGWATSEPHRRAHAPYALRGLAPGSSSLDYSPGDTSSPAWTSVTFKVTGFMNNGLTSRDNPDNWVPLRWFVFGADSFYPRGHESEFQSTIDFRYPYSKESPAQAYGIREWLWKHPDVPDGERPPFFYFWAIDERLQPLTVEVLGKDSTY